jgi:hypothetical protein
MGISRTVSDKVSIEAVRIDLRNLDASSEEGTKSR